MKTYICLYEHLGENADSAKDLRGLASDYPEINLNAKKFCCRNWDDNGLTEVDRYSIRKVILPDWLSFDEYKTNQVRWQFLFEFLKIKKIDIDGFEKYARFLITIENFSVKAKLFDLLNTRNFKSEFRRSLFNQINSWLDMPISERKYGFPLSPNQMQFLGKGYVHNTDNTYYYKSRYNEMCGW